MDHDYVYTVRLTEIIGRPLPSRDQFPIKFEEDASENFSALIFLFGRDWLPVGEVGFALMQPVVTQLWPPFKKGKQLIIWRSGKAQCARAEIIRPTDLPHAIAGSAERSDPGKTENEQE